MSLLRIRSIHHDALRSRKLAALSDGAERCWWRLQCACDDDGRAEDETDVLASLLYQVTPDVGAGEVDAWLDEMATVGLIDRYEVGGRRYLAVVGWHDKQKPRRPETSRFPAPPVPTRQDSSGLVRTTPDQNGKRPQEGLGEEGRGLGGEGECEGEGSPVAHRSETDDAPTKPTPVPAHLRPSRRH